MLRPQPFNLLGTEIRNRDWPLENGPCPRCDQHILGMKISTRPRTTCRYRRATVGHYLRVVVVDRASIVARGCCEASAYGGNSPSTVPVSKVDFEKKATLSPPTRSSNNFPRRVCL